MSCEALSASGQVGAKSVLVSSRAGSLRGWYLFNSNTVTVYLQIFDAANDGTPQLGQTPPDLSLGIPAGSGANAFEDCVRDFEKGIVIACTTTRGGNVAPANPLDFNLFFS